MAAPARAADPPSPPSEAQLDEARGHFNRGVRFYKDADYRSALVEFQEAYRVAPNVRLLFNIGQTFDELQDFAGAVKAFRGYLAGAGSSITAARRADVEKDLRRLEAHVATIDISVSEPGADVLAEGDRRIDLGKSPLSAPALLNGGTWTIVATKPGFERAEERLTAAGGDAKKIALKLAPTAEPVTAGTPVPAAVVAPPPPPRRSRAPVWIGLAVTGALAVGAGVTGVLTLGAKRDYDHELGRLPGDADAVASARTHARTLALFTDVLGGAALVAAAVTLVLYVSGSGDGSASAPSATLSPPSTARATFAPYVSLSGVGAVTTF
jgi:hypothetical protein